MRIILVLILLMTWIPDTHAKGNFSTRTVRSGYMCASKAGIQRLHQYFSKSISSISTDNLMARLRHEGFDCSLRTGILYFHINTDFFIRPDGRVVKYLEFWSPRTGLTYFSWRVEKGLVM